MGNFKWKQFKHSSSSELSDDSQKEINSKTVKVDIESETQETTPKMQATDTPGSPFDIWNNKRTILNNCTSSKMRNPLIWKANTNISLRHHFPSVAANENPRRPALKKSVSTQTLAKKPSIKNNISTQTIFEKLPGEKIASRNSVATQSLCKISSVNAFINEESENSCFCHWRKHRLRNESPRRKYFHLYNNVEDSRNRFQNKRDDDEQIGCSRVGHMKNISHVTKEPSKRSIFGIMLKPVPSPIE